MPVKVLVDTGAEDGNYISAVLLSGSLAAGQKLVIVGRLSVTLLVACV